jgi:ribonuclease T1
VASTGRWAGHSGRRSGWRRGAEAVALTFAIAVAGAGCWARGPAADEAVALSALPSEAAATHRLILTGGPFPYPKDGSVFGNRERLLPSQVRGYYREYTVPTPQSRDRGARRIVCGGQRPTVPDACYYSDDHYASFRLIAQ